MAIGTWAGGNKYSSRLMKIGVCKGASPLCRESEGVPQSYSFFPFLAR